MKLTITELAQKVNEAINSNTLIKDARQSSTLSERRIRDYMTKGLLDKPEGKGKDKWFTDSHVNQLVAIRTLQHSGLSEKYIIDKSQEQEYISTNDSLETSNHLNDNLDTKKSLLNTSSGFSSTSNNLFKAKSSPAQYGIGASISGSNVSHESALDKNYGMGDIPLASSALYSEIDDNKVQKESLDFLQSLSAVSTETNTSKNAINNFYTKTDSKSSRLEDIGKTLLNITSTYRTEEENDLIQEASKEFMKDKSQHLHTNTRSISKSFGATPLSKKLDEQNLVSATAQTALTEQDSNLLNLLKKTESKTYTEYSLDSEDKIFLKLEQSISKIEQVNLVAQIKELINNHINK